MVDTFVKAWSILKDLYEEDNMAQILTLQQQLHNLDMNERECVHDHLTKLKVARDQLASIGHKVDYVQVALIMLHKLPKGFKSFVTIVTTSNGDPSL